MQAPAPGGGVSAAEETTSCLSSGLLGLLRVSLPEDHFGAASGDMARKISLRLCATASLSENQGKILHGKIEPRGISLSYQKRGCTEDSPKSSPKGMAKGRTHNPRPKITRDGASRWRYGQSPSTSPSPHCGIGTDRHKGLLTSCQYPQCRRQPLCYKKQPGPGNCVRKRVTHHVRHTRKHECDGMISASVVELGEHGHPTLYPMRLGNGGRNEDVQDEVGRVAYDRNTQKSNPVWLNALTP